jgi:fructuronate reductase
MTETRLTNKAPINGPATPPRYDPVEHGVGIVHLGIGAFHRAHQAVMTDDALAEFGGDWRITGVSLRSDTIAKAMNPQNGMYTLIERGSSGTSARVIAAIDHVIAVDSKATLEALCDPAIRVVTLTVTEKGYGINQSTHTPDPEHPAVAADLANPSAPCGVLGLLVAAINQRRKSEYVPFTVLSCDNLPENGKLVRDGVVAFARQAYDDSLADWIYDNIAFPSSMVDRITPAATAETQNEALQQTGLQDHAAIETEPFIQWVIEDYFPSGRPKWEAGGALFVSDVAPYESMKLTMLNGSHSMLAYSGFLVGKQYVRDVISDTTLKKLVERHLEAASSLLQPLSGIDFSEYADALAERFQNPAIAHQTYQIAMDGTQKLPQRIFQPALTALETGKDIRPFAFATGMWMRYCLGYHDDGSSYQLQDPRSAEITELLNNAERSASGISKCLHGMPNLIPETLKENADWVAQIEQILARALKDGCASTLRQEINV